MYMIKKSKYKAVIAMDECIRLGFDKLQMLGPVA